MRIAYLEACGFRGYRKPMRLNFGNRFTIIDGRNGAGKSTIFDAVEFAMTGRISKYNDAKADGETVADYIWWTGDVLGARHRYVEVGFVDGATQVTIRRTHIAAPDVTSLEQLVTALCDRQTAPKDPLGQLCAAAIIRDEHITSLSLDLKEVDRYALLRGALGATDSDEWIGRGAQLVSAANQRLKAAEADVIASNNESANAARRLDEIRAKLVEESVLAEATGRLMAFAASSQPVDQLEGPVRQRLASANAEILALRSVADNAGRMASYRKALPELLSAVAAAAQAAANAQSELRGYEEIVPEHRDFSPQTMSQAIMQLASLGRSLGLRDDHCPLCASHLSYAEFEKGIASAEALASRLDEESVRVAARERLRAVAQANFASAVNAERQAKAQCESAQQTLATFDVTLAQLGIAAADAENEARSRADQLQRLVEVAQGDLRVLDTLRLSSSLETAQSALAAATSRVTRAQETYSKAERVLTVAQALHDAARRAAAETLDQRLERVLPLMAELYRRLRPHPVWNDIEYSIRGDVKRFLKLKVGDDLNPQFLFSSGQRRATGIAFLLSVNLSLAWSRWRSILLDDPVQHVDDFRAVHLAEVAAQLVGDGRQVICAVEDAALADLLCRRLPVEEPGDGTRVTLGHDAEGMLTKLVDRELIPFRRFTVLDESEARVAS